jgi:hypothetical protein
MSLEDPSWAFMTMREGRLCKSNCSDKARHRRSRPCITNLSIGIYLILFHQPHLLHFIPLIHVYALTL